MHADITPSAFGIFNMLLSLALAFRGMLEGEMKR